MHAFNFGTFIYDGVERPRIRHDLYVHRLSADKGCPHTWHTFVSITTGF